ncbi:MAG: sensor histidine kinase [Acidobacteria bacterium]|nr:sensor histidine kinase [Acidobacteriota bacterium]
MGLRIRHLATRFALLLALAAIVPLVGYGAISILSLQRATRESVVAGNENVATRAAEEIRRYITTDAEILKALAADLQDTGLTQAQQDRILKNYILQFQEFHELTLFDKDGRPLATSRIGEATVPIPSRATTTVNDVEMSPIRVDDDLLPTALFAVRLTHLNQPAGWLVGEISVEEMWRMVDRIRIGRRGFALVVAPDGQLVAHGDPDKKTLIAQATNLSAHPLVQAAGLPGAKGPISLEYLSAEGFTDLGAAARIPGLDWTVIVEQPTEEAYAAADQLRRQLVAAISIALFAMIAAGWVWGRSFITPILALKRATHEVASGQLETRVRIDRADELGDLEQSFNTMAERLVKLQEEVKRQAQHAMFGRLAAGLVHDLSHPIQNIGNSTKLMMRDDVDAESREMFRRTVDREIATLKRFLDDLRNVVKPKPIERFAMDVNAAVAEIVDSMRPQGERSGVGVEAQLAPGPLAIEGDRFALGRVFRNLIANAIQATAAGGRVLVTTVREGGVVQISVADTGSGIPADRLPTIFDEFVTTKARGLGLGLAISKRIVEQLDGTIAVASEVGHGTAFTLRFPARDDDAAQAAAS